ncbi:Polyphenol oxidase, chloroplastic [Vitis vinifera]|uniref:Polyphenol oxidase, chloroplastic n=1 Tax=Vitis vinifera TaxID=29760 RepID=A0A438CKL2_VITVI|nr:Polyphenol oxidase, chloroplastic [Vitis vinifera]
MWMLWKAIGGKNRTEFTDPDSLNAGFVFYDENAQLVRVKYAAQSEDDHQKFQVGSSESGGTPKTTISSSGGFPKPLNSVIRVEVPWPKKSRSKKKKEDEEEVLLKTIQ